MCKAIGTRLWQPIPNCFRATCCSLRMAKNILDKIEILECTELYDMSTRITTIIAFRVVLSGQLRILSPFEFPNQVLPFRDLEGNSIWSHFAYHLKSLIVNSGHLCDFFRYALLKTGWLMCTSSNFLHFIHICGVSYICACHMFLVIKTSLHSAQIVDDLLVYQNSKPALRRSQTLGQNVPSSNELLQPNTLVCKARPHLLGKHLYNTLGYTKCIAPHHYHDLCKMQNLKLNIHMVLLHF